MSTSGLERDVHYLKIWAVVSALLLAGAAWMLISETRGGIQAFAEITVERINVVDADGRLAIVLAGPDRIPGPILNGEELSRELSQGREGSAGLIFVSPQGNEVGGLVYRSSVEPGGGYSAGSSLNFDQHNQDQVIGVQYSDNGTNRRYGLSVWDRPTTITLQELRELAGASPDRQQIEQAFRDLIEERGETSVGARRVFLGNEDRVVSLRLADVGGRDRIRISVDELGAPRLEFFDEQGQVVYALPAEGP